MEAFLAQVAATARKASDQGYSKQGRPPVQEKSSAADRPMKKGAGRQRSPSALARNNVRNGNEERHFSKVSAVHREWSEHDGASSWFAGAWGHAARGACPAPGAAPDAPWS